MKQSVLFIIILGSVLAFFNGTPACAQLFIEEGKVNLSVAGGDRITQSITVHNNSQEPLDIRVYWEDFDYAAPFDGAKNFLAAGTSPHSAASWIQFRPQEFRIMPSGKQKIDYTISVPGNIEGGYYGVLFFERSSEATVDTKGVKIVTRVGSLFFIESQNKTKKAGIADVAMQGGALAGTLANHGNVVLIPTMTYYIMDESGMVADRGSLPTLYIPPGASAPWNVPLPKGLAAGQYTLMLNADLEEGDIAVKEITLQKSASDEFLIQKVQD